MIAPVITIILKDDNQNSNSPKALTLIKLITKIAINAMVIHTAGLTLSPVQYW